MRKTNIYRKFDVESGRIDIIILVNSQCYTYYAYTKYRPVGDLLYDPLFMWPIIHNVMTINGYAQYACLL